MTTLQNPSIFGGIGSRKGRSSSTTNAIIAEHPRYTGRFLEGHLLMQATALAQFIDPAPMDSREVDHTEVRGEAES